MDEHVRLRTRMYSSALFDTGWMFVNGNPASHEAFQANQRAAFSGLCLAIVQSTRMYPSATNPSTIRVTAMSAGLHTHSVTVSAR